MLLLSSTPRVTTVGSVSFNTCLCHDSMCSSFVILASNSQETDSTLPPGGPTGPDKPSRPSLPGCPGNPFLPGVPGREQVELLSTSTPK